MLLTGGADAQQQGPSFARKIEDWPFTVSTSITGGRSPGQKIPAREEEQTRLRHRF